MLFSIPTFDLSAVIACHVKYELIQYCPVYVTRIRCAQLDCLARRTWVSKVPPTRVTHLSFY